MTNNTSIRSMNRLAAVLLLALVTFLAGFFYYSWMLEKAVIIKEQENVLKFMVRHIDGYFDRLENRLLRLSYELTDGFGQRPNEAIVLLKGHKARNRDLSSILLTRENGKTFEITDLQTSFPTVN